MQYNHNTFTATFTMKPNFFLRMITSLRKEERVILYNNLLEISTDEKDAVALFLEKEYQKETLTFPYEDPAFHYKSAVWAAEIVYQTAQLILYRKKEVGELENLLPKENFVPTAATILSVDLSLRFLPDMIQQLKLIDHDDALIPLLELIIKKWHYSAINYSWENEEVVKLSFTDNPCVQQLYLDRVVRFKNSNLAKNSKINSLLKSNFGMFEDDFWKNFNLLKTND